jgi:hypothetical protein
MKYLIGFTGRKVGAIGVFYPILKEIELDKLSSTRLTNMTYEERGKIIDCLCEYELMCLNSVDVLPEKPIV